jgi:choline dehydrogenase-like flavoprotein
VSLAEERDTYGVPKPRLEWRPGGPERQTFDALTHAVVEQFETHELGRVVPEPWLTDGTWREHVFDTFHHLGTTPIGTVTDADGLVTGTSGVYAAGGSLFPTTGAANPTLTMIALALRLADRLRG